LKQNWGILNAIRTGQPWDERAGVARAADEYRKLKNL